MKKCLKRVVYSSIFIGTLTAMPAFSQSTNDDGQSSSTSANGTISMEMFDFHNHNRALAFGSVIMGNHGADVTKWKAVDGFEICASDSEPIPQPVEPINPDQPHAKVPTPTCSWDVYYVTKYDFIECPDGSYFVGRSGEGVSLLSKTEGVLFSWAETGFCQDDPFNPTPRNLAKQGNGSDKDRRLDFKHIKKVYQ